MTTHDELIEGLGALERAALAAFLASTRRDDGDATSHQQLDLRKLVRMLLADVALMVHRPGSWEGAGMAQLLAGHGYRAHASDAHCIAVRLLYWGGKDPYAKPPMK